MVYIDLVLRRLQSIFGLPPTALIVSPGYTSGLQTDNVESHAARVFKGCTLLTTITEYWKRTRLVCDLRFIKFTVH